MSNVLEHIYSPRGACAELFKRRDDEVLISGPAGTGKSRACMEKIHLMCLRNPNLRALIVRKTQKSLGSTALVTWRKFVARESIESGGMYYYGGSAAEAPQYRYKNGSTVTIGGMDNPMRIMSSEYDVVYVQEATELTIEDIESITSRLRNWTISFQQLIMDCNPASDKHPLKRRCNEGKTILLESRHEDNPVLFNEDGTLTEKGRVYIGKLDRLTGVRHKRLRLGLWVSAEGVVYEEFDPAIHVIENQSIPPEWPRYWVIDFGFVHPFVCQFWTEDPDGALIMYREIYMTGRTVEQHAKDILAVVTKPKIIEGYNPIIGEMEQTEIREWIEPKPFAVICDHDAEGRRTFEKHTGLGTQRAIKFVSDGIDLAKERMRIRDDGYAQLYIMRDTLVERDEDQADAVLPTCTLEEIGGYAWKLNNDGRKKEEPVKQDDDGMDCMRYMVAYKDYKGKARLRIVQ